VTLRAGGSICITARRALKPIDDRRTLSSRRDHPAASVSGTPAHYSNHLTLRNLGCLNQNGASIALF
jgi:hypothetical protein